MAGLLLPPEAPAPAAAGRLGGVLAGPPTEGAGDTAAAAAFDAPLALPLSVSAMIFVYVFIRLDSTQVESR